jgi:hypothetical protein
LQCDREETGPFEALNIMAESTLRKLGRLSPYFRVIGRHRSHTETTRTTSVPSALNPLLRTVLTLKLVTRGTGAWTKRGRGPKFKINYIHQLLRVMSQPKRVQISSNEGRILLALSAVQSGQCKTPSAASKMYSVPRNTLYRRINGQTSREDYTPTNRRLSLIEEEVIVENILKLDA